MKNIINKLIQNCSSVNESHWVRTTIKLSPDNLKRLRMMSEENETFSQSKIVNFVLNAFFDEQIDESILNYNYDLQQIYEDYLRDPNAVTKILSRLISLARTNKNSPNSKIKENCLTTLEFIYDVFSLFSLINKKGFETAKGYFIGNLSWLRSEKEVEFVHTFGNNYSLMSIKGLLDFILSDKENLSDQKYEFALRNIEVTFSEYVQCEKSSVASDKIGKHITLLLRNKPSLLNINEALNKDLQILMKPFSEVLQHVKDCDYSADDVLQTIHLYLGGGVDHFDVVRKIIKTHGIKHEFSDVELERVYRNLCYLEVGKEYPFPSDSIS